MRKIIFVTTLLLIGVIINLNAATFTTTTSGDWATGSTWVGGIAPGSTDNIIIASGHTVDISANRVCNTLTVNGGIRWTTLSGRTLTVNGALITNTCLLSSFSASTIGKLIVNNNWTVNAGTTTIGTTTATLLVSMPNNTITLNGTLSFIKLGGAHVFNNIIINTTGTWICGSTFAQNFTINGNITNNGIFNSGGINGIYTLTGIGKVLAGDSLLEFKGITNCTGDYTNNNVKGVTVKSLTGDGGTFTQGDNSILTLKLYGDDATGDFYISTFNAAATGNTVIYGLAPQTGVTTVKNPSDATYYNLTFGNSSSAILGDNISVSNDLLIGSGSALDMNGFATLTVKGAFINNGNFSAQTGKVILNGSSAQTIGGSANTQFYDLDVDNAAGVTLISNQSIQKTLNVINGTFTTTGVDFTLLSSTTDPNLTARIGQLSTGSISGPIVMQRYLRASLLTDWRYISSPVTATVSSWIPDFPTSGFPGADNDQTNTLGFCSIQTYNEPTAGGLDSGFINITSSTQPIGPGKGFSAYVGNSLSGQAFTSPITISVTGIPAQGNVNVTVSGSGATSVDGWNLVGNPYPSDIDWNALSSGDKAAITGSMYIYNPAIGVYITYNGTISVPYAGPLDHYIPSSAAFWVQANPGGGTLAFHETAKADISREAYAPGTGNASDVKLLRLTVTGNGLKDETAIRAKNDATADFDKAYDAYKLPSTNVLTLTTVMNGKDMVINALPLTGNAAIPLRVKVPKTGTYVIAKGINSTWSLSSCIILEDLLTGTKTDLRTNSYSFSINDSTKAPRFLVHLSEAINKSSVAVSCYGKNDGQVTAKGIGNGPFTYVWKDSKGTTLRTTANINTADVLGNLTAGIYSVDILGGSPVCGDIADTLVVTEPKELTPAFDVLPVNCKGGNTGSATATVKGGTQPYSYKWSNNATSAAIKDLAIGEYTVIVTDAHNCSATAAATVKALAAVKAAFTPQKSTIYLVQDEGKAVFVNASTGAATYKWDFGDTTAIETIDNPEHYYTKTGTYKVRLIAKTADCIDTTYQQIIVKFDATTTVNEIAKNNNISIGTVNSEQAFIKFDYTANNAALINVQNILGQDVSSVIKVLPNNQTVYLDLSTTINKVLLITVTTANGRITKKILR